MRISFKSLFASLLALLMAIPPQAIAYNSTSDRTQKIALAKSVADNLIRFLNRGKSDINSLLEWLDKNPNATVPSTNACSLNPGFNCFFNRDIPRLQKRLRLYLAMTFSPLISGSDLSLIDVAGNPLMFAPPAGPLKTSLEPLSPDEKAQAQAELELFWDGKPLSEIEALKIETVTGRPTQLRLKGVIEDYIEILQKKLENTKTNPLVHDQLLNNLTAFEKSRQLPTTQQRIQGALQINDSQWIAYRKSRLEMARQLMMNEIWKLADQFRFLVYLTNKEANFKNSALALERSNLDNKNYADRVLTAQKDVEQFKSLEYVHGIIDPDREGARLEKNAIESMKWLLSHDEFVDETIAQHPEWKEAAEDLRRQIDKKYSSRRTAITVMVVAPLILLIPPVAVALGTVGAISLTGGMLVGSAVMWNDSINRYNELQSRYMARWTPDSSHSPFSDPAQMRAAYQEMMLTPLTFSLVLGLPLTRPGAFKNL